MQIWESITIALRALMSNKLRTGLTMLGIIIGVGAVISLVSIGNGVSADINSRFSDLGTNVLWVSSGLNSGFRGPGSGPPPPPPEEGGPGANQRPALPLTLDDAAAIADPALIANVVDVTVEYRPGVNNVVYQQEELTGRVTGVTAPYLTVRNYSLLYGQFLSEEHVNRRARVAVISEYVAYELFAAYEYPIGLQIRIGGVPFEVIGVLASKGQSGFGESEDKTILIPVTTAQTRLGKSSTSQGSLVVNTIYIQASSAEAMTSISEQLTTLMRARHNLTTPDKLNDFTITNQSELLAFGNTLANTLTAFLGAIAGISLLVGGIGIMNIMLVSVTERTREIGIRKAVGAKQRDIMIQFLIESMVLSLIGGAIGIAIGYGVSFILPLALPNRFSNTVVTFNSVLLATGFSMAIGLFFGVYPATRAAALKPIDALRYE